MAGTKEGGKKVAAIMKARDPDYYIKLGHRGGSAPWTLPKGFAAMTKEKRMEAGSKGGRISKRGPSRKPEIEEYA